MPSSEKSPTISQRVRIRVRVPSSIDESVGEKLADLEEKLVGKLIEFDCSKIKTINSIGFRTWIHFLRKLAPRCKFEFHCCPPLFVEFSSLLEWTAFAKSIVSFSVPFVCEDCGAETPQTFETASLEGVDELGPISCDKCNGVAMPIVTLAEMLGSRSGDD